ncbi:hypothetical protein SPFL3102_02153 [Sporomusaceae bacterium FL31]|nr:hypothetical protein SPFL3101_03787 [Sporomusaceae bacterium FL31]GCE34342.1 hypothetical protein SPFL3102_02153 [Sporomusaceae bacterium]
MRDVKQNERPSALLFDGSIIRSSLSFNGQNLINHSHLWWPAPYINDTSLTDVFTPQNQYEDFMTDPKWMDKVIMRSPIRIDFDAEKETEKHPLVHMHTQNYETRLHVDEPICFSKFMKYIFQNFYPEIELEYQKWNLLSFSYRKPRVLQHDFSSIVL